MKDCPSKAEFIHGLVKRYFEASLNGNQVISPIKRRSGQCEGSVKKSLCVSRTIQDLAFVSQKRVTPVMLGT
jgi:hypothetical protein